MSSTNDISIPLLRNLPRHEHKRDEQFADYDEEVCMRGSESIAHDSSPEESHNEKSGDQSRISWWFDSCVLSIVVCFLVFLQFGIVFYTTPVEATTGLRWSMVIYRIVLNVLSTVLYRQSLKDCDMSYAATLLLPEILIDTMLYLVLFDKGVATFWLLLAGMLCLALFVAANRIRLLLIVPSASNDEDTADLKQTQDKFAVSFC
jgi:hypothetical protein